MVGGGLVRDGLVRDGGAGADADGEPPQPDPDGPASRYGPLRHGPPHDPAGDDSPRRESP